MDISQYKNFLVKIKQEFQAKLITHKSNALPVEQVSKLLYRHVHEEPLLLRDFLLKGTGKFQVTWDDLLQYLQQQIAIGEEVKKIEHCPVSSTEILDNHLNEFGKLMQYVKSKETNAVESIKALPAEVGGRDLYLVCMDRELVIYDLQNKEVLNNITFGYSKMKQKIFEKEQQKRIQKQRLSQAQASEYLDKVDANLQYNAEEVKKSSLGRFLTSNIRNSRRGSALSSHNSDKMMFRKQTESGDAKKRTKSNVIRVKNDDISKIFQIFENASINNSISVAKAFTEARTNFHKHIVLDRAVLEKERPDRHQPMMSELYHNNYQGQLTKMRSTSLDLNKIRKVMTKNNQKHFFIKAETPTKADLVLKEDNLMKPKRPEIMQSIGKEVLQIVNISIIKSFLLVSLFNRQIRLLRLKRGLISITGQTLMQKQFKSIVTFLQLYRAENNGQYRIMLVLEKGGKGHNQDMKKSISQGEEGGVSEIIVFHLDHEMQIKNKAFQCEINFSANYRCALPYGLVLFNEKGHFAIVELNSYDGKTEEKLVCQTTLFNPETNYRVSTNGVRVHRNMTSFYLCCSNGFVYLFDRLSRRLKYWRRVSPSAAIDLHLIREDTELIVLSNNGNMVILSTLHLQKIFLYQSYHEVSMESKIFSTQPNKFFIYTSRNISAYLLSENEERLFVNTKPVKIMKNRIKMKGKATIQAQRQRNRVLKVIEGKGGLGDFICLVLQQGEISLFGPQLNYIGSYHSLKVNSLLDVACNESYQFIAILFDDNSLEIANLYTQQVLFVISLPEKEKASRNQSANSSNLERNRSVKSKLRQSISLVNFFSPQSLNLFLGIITVSNNVYHFSSKGQKISSTNLQQSCGEFIGNVQKIYVGEELMLLTDRSISILHRHSYFKKSVIAVSDEPLVKVKRAQIDNVPGLVCVDSACKIFLVDIHHKKVRIINQMNKLPRAETYLFNESLVCQLGTEISKVKVAGTLELSIRTDVNLYSFAVIGEFLVQISKSSSRLFRFKRDSEAFQQFFL